jgi:hypothetical protein
MCPLIAAAAPTRTGTRTADGSEQHPTDAPNTAPANEGCVTAITAVTLIVGLVRCALGAVPLGLATVGGAVLAAVAYALTIRSRFADATAATSRLTPH